MKRVSSFIKNVHKTGSLWKICRVAVVVLAAFMLAGCGRVHNEEVHIEITEEGRNWMQWYVDHGYKDSWQPENLDGFMAAMAVDGIPDFPENAQYTNKLDSFKCGENNVYTLTGDKEPEMDVVYIHGGGYFSNIDQSVISYCDLIASSVPAKVYMPLYSLCPSGNCEEAYDFLTQAYELILKDDRPIVIMGDSAGGGLALGFVEYLGEKKIKKPEKMVLLSPWVDATMSNPDIPKYNEVDVSLDYKGLAIAGERWADNLDVKDYRVSPIYGKIKKMPEALIYTGTSEVMYPDNRLLFEKLTKANCKATLVVGDGLYHVFANDSEIPEGRESEEIMLEFISGTGKK